MDGQAAVSRGQNEPMRRYNPAAISAPFCCERNLRPRYPIAGRPFIAGRFWAGTDFSGTAPAPATVIYGQFRGRSDSLGRCRDTGLPQHSHAARSRGTLMDRIEVGIDGNVNSREIDIKGRPVPFAIRNEPEGMGIVPDAAPGAGSSNRVAGRLKDLGEPGVFANAFANVGPVTAQYRSRGGRRQPPSLKTGRPARRGRHHQSRHIIVSPST